MQKKNLGSPDETRSFDKGKIELANFEISPLGEQSSNQDGVGRNASNRWSKPIAGEAPHTQYMVSGRMKVVMDDGTEDEFGPGDALVVPPGHNAWVVGNEPVVAVDFTGLKDYARK